MVIVLVLYAALVYLLVFKLKVIPRNTFTRLAIILIGLTIGLSFMAGLQTLTPASSQGAIVTRIVEIAPQVNGRVASVMAERNKVVEKGSVLFTIDPTMYQARVDELTTQIKLSEVRQQQFEELAAKSAGSMFQYQQGQMDLRRLKAQLVSAQFDLDNCIVRAPFKGKAPKMALRVGMQVSASRSVLSFLDSKELFIGGLFAQKALEHAEIGDKAQVNFFALPGRVFETKVLFIPSAIGDSQILASGQLPKVEGVQYMTRKFPIYVEVPDDLPEHLRRPGLGALIYIHTDGAGVVAPVANAAQWINSSLDTIR
jgi:multidrug resistance efflux pump